MSSLVLFVGLNGAWEHLKHLNQSDQHDPWGTQVKSLLLTDRMTGRELARKVKGKNEDGGRSENAKENIDLLTLIWLIFIYEMINYIHEKY